MRRREELWGREWTGREEIIKHRVHMKRTVQPSSLEDLVATPPPPPPIPHTDILTIWVCTAVHDKAFKPFFLRTGYTKHKILGQELGVKFKRV